MVWDSRMGKNNDGGQTKKIYRVRLRSSTTLLYGSDSKILKGTAMFLVTFENVSIVSSYLLQAKKLNCNALTI
jgi:hypothetical protein